MNRILLFIAMALFLTGCKSESKRELHLYIWSDAIKPQLIRNFEVQHNCKVVVDTYDSNEALYAKLRLGATGYDLIFPSHYLIGLMVRQELLQPIETEKIPNLSHLDTTYPPFSADAIYGIPYLVSYTGLGYRKDKVADFTPSWNIFSERKLKGRMTMLNDVREALGAGLLYLGMSVNTKESDQVDQAANQLIIWKPNLAKFESEQYKNGIASAEYLVVQGYSGDILQVMQEDDQVGFAYPKEGTTYSIDYAALLKGASEPDLAHAFLNYLLEPEVAKENILFTCYLHPNRSAYPLLPKDLRESPLLFPPSEVLQKAEMIQYLGGEVLRIYSEAWDRVKSARK